MLGLKRNLIPRLELEGQPPSPLESETGGGLSLCLAADGADKSQKPLEIRAFGQKESTATLIHIVSELRCFYGK